MSNQFLAEIRIFGFNFAPTGWAFCNGQLLPISQNTALFSLLGTYYGGDGKSTFALPDLQGMTPMQTGQGQGLSERFLGEIGGSETVTLLESEIPAHIHATVSHTPVTGTASVPGPSVSLGLTGAAQVFTGTAAPATGTLGFAATGSSLPHSNMQPYLAANFCIALQGVFPQRP
jgi:microcystin-dependent protein